MCGICGCLGIEVSPEKAKKAIARISHRGPDANGIHLEQDVFLGHTRLAILDLSEDANQPMWSSDQNFAVVFNGEIYNFQELRGELEGSGIEFRTSSDTEVIINGFMVWGRDLFVRLNGIFALAIWNKQQKKLTLARDRFGVKPLYYSYNQGRLSFGSEIKTLLEFTPNQTINRQAFREFLDYGNPLGEQTLYEGIKELKPGSLLEYEEATLKGEYTFWNLTDVEVKDIPDEEVISSTHTLLENAVKRQLVSDVPVGVFLSGGIDSSLVTAFASKQFSDTKLTTYTAAFDFDIGVNELDKARKVAEYYDTDHHELFIEGKDLPYVVESLVRHHDSPFSDAANIPLYLLTKALGDSVKVILQGDGGDEFFAGYRRYQLLQKYGSNAYRLLFGFANWASNVTRLGSPRIRRMMGALGANSDVDLMALLLTVDTQERSTFQTLSPAFKRELSDIDAYQHYRKLNELFSVEDIVQRMLYVDTNTILPRTFLEKVDKSTMANAVEVRVPLLDNELTEFVLGLPSHQKIRGGEKKWLLKAALRGVVPDFVLDGKKTGFGVPYENWIKEPLYEQYNDVINSQSFRQLGIFDPKVLERYMREHKVGSYNNGFILWKIFHFGIWVSQYKMSFK